MTMCDKCMVPKPRRVVKVKDFTTMAQVELLCRECYR